MNNKHELYTHVSTLKRNVSTFYKILMDIYKPKKP